MTNNFVIQKSGPVSGAQCSGVLSLHPGHLSYTSLFKITDFNFQTHRFKIGVEPGKRKVKSLYLTLAPADETGTFGFTQAAKSYTLQLANNRVDYAAKKQTFTVLPFDFEPGVTSYELRFDEATDKPIYTGKKRGPKPKSVAVLV